MKLFYKDFQAHSFLFVYNVCYELCPSLVFSIVTGRGQHSRDKCISSSVFLRYDSYLLQFKMIFAAMIADSFLF